MINLLWGASESLTAQSGPLTWKLTARSVADNEQTPQHVGPEEEIFLGSADIYGSIKFVEFMK